MYEAEQVELMSAKVHDVARELYDEYKRNASSTQIGVGVGQSGGSSTSNTTITQSNALTSSQSQQQDDSARNAKKLKHIQFAFQKFITESEGSNQKSELDRYLGEEREIIFYPQYNVLNWWKLNSPRYPILALLARDVLAVPMSTVASESSFSTEGRVLDSFRSSLTPRIVQALLCAQDWMGKTPPSRCLEESEEDIQELNKLDLGFKLHHEHMI